ncbi:hypothetical protein DWB64_04755 [Fusibacter sp. A1]|nr:hypothetical protein DWB64_04755 [Fusibacter sp. A1]
MLKSPKELISKPKLIGNQEVAREVIDQNLPANARLVRPYISENLSSVDFFDWDKDGEDEVYAFYTDKTRVTSGVMIIDRNEDGWEKRATVEAVGSDIAFASFIDFNEDGIEDIVLGLTTEGEAFKSLVVYEWQKDGYVELYKDLYTEIIIDDIDRDFLKDLFVLKLDRNNFASATLLKYEVGEFRIVDEIALDENVNGYYNVVFAKASKELYGVFLDSKIGSKSATNIIAYDDGRLKRVFDESVSDSRYQLTVKDIPIISQDIDGDGIYEIGNRFLPHIYDEDKSELPYLNTWYEWSGDSLDLDKMNYISESEGYRFDFPKRWADAIIEGKMIIIKSRAYLSRQYLDVYITPDESVLYKVFTLEAVSQEGYKDLVKELQEEGVPFYKLGELRNLVYLGYNRLPIDNILESYRAFYDDMLLKEIEIRTQFQFLD